MRARTWLILASSVAACGDKGDGPSPSQISSSVAHAGSGSAGSAVSLLPPGWRREDLVKHQLAASIAVPADAKVTPSRMGQRDPDGIAITIPIVTITGEAPAMKLSSDVVLGWVPTTAEAELANNAKREKPFEVADQKETATGEWAIAYRWDTGDCYVRSWSPRAKLWCENVDLKIRCTAIETPLAMCTSLEPSGPPIEQTVDPATAFPRLTDPQAAEAAVTVARAIARNDREALLGMVGHVGIMLKGKKLSAKGLRTLLEGDTIQRAFEMSCKPLPGQRESQCLWTAEGEIRQNTFAVLANDGYGLVPRFTMTKGAGGRWLLTNVDMPDLGPP